jgi:hypothetical protein
MIVVFTVFNAVCAIVMFIMWLFSRRLNRETVRMLKENEVLLDRMVRQAALWDVRTERLRRIRAGHIEGPS